MPSELEALEAQAEQLAVAATGRPEADDARRLAERLRTGRFKLLVVGEFNRGKSTLVNALLGEEVVPTGVLPVTAVTTELVFGEPAAVVEHVDGTTELVATRDIEEFVAEERNPRNERGVARVDVRGRWSLLEAGVMLVDTPGIGSIYRHNTEAAHTALLEADGAIVVFSADSPLSEQERSMLSHLAMRQAATFFVLNKCDHLSPSELDKVRRYVGTALRKELGRQTRLYAVDARAAFVANAFRLPPSERALEFNRLVMDLERFIAADLVGTRLRIARHELVRLGSSLRDSLTVERAALDMDAVELARQAERFAVEAAEQRHAFDDDRAILARDVAQLADRVRRRLTDFAEAAPADHFSALAEIAASAPRRRLTDDLRAAVEAAIQRSFEAFRQQEADRTDAEWRTIAERFRSRTEQRVDAVRQVAARLFAVPLPRLEVPAVAEEHERFFYLFLHVGSSTEQFERALARLVPGSIARPWALARARTELVREFDKHAGRARWDLTQRLDNVRRAFERAMKAELDAAVKAIVAAAARAEELQGEAEERRQQHAAEADRLQALAGGLVGLAKKAPEPSGTPA